MKLQRSGFVLRGPLTPGAFSAVHCPFPAVGRKASRLASVFYFRHVKDCVFCAISRTKRNRDLWTALNEGGYKKVHEWADSQNVPCNRRSIRAHFEYHTPLQSPGKRIGRKKQADLARKLVDRKRQTLDLVFRVPGLTGEAISRALYWHGDDKLVAADKSALRDLKEMMRSDLCFRAFVSNMDGPSSRLNDQKGMFYPGICARPMMESLYGFELRAKDLVSDVSALGDWRSAYPKAKSGEVISRLLLEMPGAGKVRWAQINGHTIGFDYRSWLGPHLLPVFDDPLREAKRVRAGGMFALSHSAESSRILPFYYHYDSGARPVEFLVEDMLSPMRLERSGQIGEFYPDMDPSTVIPYVVVCSSRERLSYLREVARTVQAPRERFIAMACLEEDLSLGEPAFVRLYQDADPADLVSVLVSYYEKRPVEADYLRWTSVRRKTVVE